MQTVNRLFWVFAGRTGHFVGFVMWWLNMMLINTLNMFFVENWRVIFSYYLIPTVSIFLKFSKNIRIFNGLEVRIENSVMRVTVQHRKACRVMPNSYPEWQNSQFARNDHYWFFFLHILPSTIAFELYMRYFISIRLKYQYFQPRNVWFSSYLWLWCQNLWPKMMSKLTL